MRGYSRWMAVILEERYRAVPESVPAARNAVRDALTSRKLASDLQAEIALAVTEAVANAILHAYPNDTSGTIAVTVSQTRTATTVTVADTGVGIDAEISPAGLGYGLQLIGHLTADHTITSSHGKGTTIAMNFRTTRRLVLVSDARGHADGL